MTLAWERRGVGRARAIDRRGGQNTDAASGRPLRASTGLSFFSRLPRAALPPQPSTTAASRRAAATRASARAGAPASEPPSAVACCPALSAAVKIPEGKNAVCHVNVVNMQFQIVEYACLPTGGSPIANPIKHGTKLRLPRESGITQADALDLGTLPSMEAYVAAIISSHGSDKMHEIPDIKVKALLKEPASFAVRLKAESQGYLIGARQLQ